MKVGLVSDGRWRSRNCIRVEFTTSEVSSARLTVKKLVLGVSATAFRSLAARGWDPFGWRFGISGAGRRKDKDGGNGYGMAIFLWVSYRRRARARGWASIKGGGRRILEGV